MGNVRGKVVGNVMIRGTVMGNVRGKAMVLALSLSVPLLLSLKLPMPLPLTLAPDDHCPTSGTFRACVVASWTASNSGAC